MTNKASTPDYVNTTTQRIRDILEWAKFERIGQISASRVQEYLAKLRADGRSIASSNHYLPAIKMFTRWLVRDRRSHDDRLAHLSKMNAELDRRRVRRPLSMEEFELLLEAAHTGPDMQHVAGPDRAVLYILAVYTGFRRNEIGSVKSRSFVFDSDPPTLTVQAGYSKRRRTDILPLRRDFAERIQGWMATKPSSPTGTPLFNVSHRQANIRDDSQGPGNPPTREAA